MIRTDKKRSAVHSTGWNRFRMTLGFLGLGLMTRHETSTVDETTKWNIIISLNFNNTHTCTIIYPSYIYISQ